jgi:predicted flap endonuclease-1-like 5' DNA nuclease
MDTSTLLTVQLHCFSFALLVAYASTTHINNNNNNNNNTINDMSPAEEPPTKKAKSEVADDWKDHAMNIEEAVMKADEVTFLSDMAKGGVQVLQGIGPKAEQVLDHLGIDSLQELADYKFYKIAKAIQVLSTTEGKRIPGSTMNIDHALDKEHETKSFKEILQLPLSALEGLTPKADETLKGLNVVTIEDLATWKYPAQAEAICTLAQYEETKSKEERHLEKELKKLA